MLFLSVSLSPFFLLVFNLQRYEFLHQSCKFYLIVQKNRIPQVNSEVTLLPLQGEKLFDAINSGQSVSVAPS